MYNLSAFKGYDIRGIWQTEIDEEFGRIMGFSLGLHLIERYKTPKILISSDVREANNVFIDYFLRGIRSAGIEEVTIIGYDETTPQYKYGVCSTPIAYYGALDTFDCLCLFTASHNPSEYLGIKIVDRKCLPVKSNELKAIFQEQEKNTITDSGKPVIKNYDGPRIDEILTQIEQKFTTLTKIPKITIDYSHGAATHFEQIFLKKVLGENSVHIFTNPDGNFPAHDTDTSRFANYQKLIKEVQKNGSDFGFIFDGDADRFGMVIPDGTVVTGDILLSIIAKQLLLDGTAERLGSRAIFQEVFCGRIVGDTVSKYGGDLHMMCVGRAAFVEKVIQSNGLLAGEVSTHLLFKEYGTIEMPIAGLFYLLKALENYENATQMIREFDVYARGQVIQFHTEKKDEIIAALTEKYKDLKQITIDGIRIEAPDWWFCVRKSNTEPLLKLALEASNRALYDEILSEMRIFFQSYGAVEKL